MAGRSIPCWVLPRENHQGSEDPLKRRPPGLLRPLGSGCGSSLPTSRPGPPQSSQERWPPFPATRSRWATPWVFKTSWLEALRAQMGGRQVCGTRCPDLARYSYTLTLTCSTLVLLSLVPHSITIFFSQTSLSELSFGSDRLLFHQLQHFAKHVLNNTSILQAGNK